MLSKGTRIQLRLTWYLALTSNTLQHGARIDLRLKASKFRLDGHLSYDALIQFDPFRFMVLFSAGVGLKWGSRTLAAVLLEGTLSGHSPWHTYPRQGQVQDLDFLQVRQFRPHLGVGSDSAAFAGCRSQAGTAFGLASAGELASVVASGA